MLFFSLVYLASVTCSSAVPLLLHKCACFSFSLFNLILRTEMTNVKSLLPKKRNLSKSCPCCWLLTTASLFWKTVSRLHSFLFSILDFWNEASKTLTSATNSGWLNIVWRGGVYVHQLEQFSSSTRTSSQVSWTTLCCVSECVSVDLHRSAL